ncbi:PREDICTED: sodium channel protein Nach-like [Papilio polytes]|uniref:sodium channel protein Nach-like n=1 Tax=Papilio polytes TaxID=76194 RepID=UPI000676882C|nr:PREDICTED: sodium channel protein Nach-like [Papilio polytes]
MALRDIFKKCFVGYTKNSSILGFKQMTDPNTSITKRLAWLLVFGLMCGIGGYFLWYLWFGSLSSPLIVNMESSMYPISKIEFPAVAICNINIISKTALLELERNIFKTNVSGNITFSRIRQLGRLLDYSYDVDIESFLHEEFLNNNDGVKYEPKVISTMKKLAPKCKEMLLLCFWAGKKVDCESIFDIRRTNKGFCCTFNYILNYNAAGTPSKRISQVKRQYYPGPLFGLNLLIDPLIEDYTYTTRPGQGVEILIFEPTHYADPNSGRVSQRFVQPGQFLQLGLKSIKQVATPEVRKYNPETRKCLFRDERKKEYEDMYSYSACIYNCRIKAIHALCGCTPYAFPIVSDKPTCTLNDLSCLDKIKERLLLIYPIGSKNTEGLDREFQESLYCPQCHPDCEFTKHESQATKINYQHQYIKTLKLHRFLTLQS